MGRLAMKARELAAGEAVLPVAATLYPHVVRVLLLGEVAS
jgi:hypothetical protein